jgi:hypothetical protein
MYATHPSLYFPGNTSPTFASHLAVVLQAFVMKMSTMPFGSLALARHKQQWSSLELSKKSPINQSHMNQLGYA